MNTRTMKRIVASWLIVVLIISNSLFCYADEIEAIQNTANGTSIDPSESIPCAPETNLDNTEMSKRGQITTSGSGGDSYPLIDSASGFYFEIDNDTQTATITGANYRLQENDDLVVPQNVSNNGIYYTVTKIGDNADISGIHKTLSLPNTLKSIGKWAFANCDRIAGNLVIPEGVIDIGEGAFVNCKRFDGDLIIPDSVVTIGDRAFENCCGFNGNLIIGNGVETVGERAFFQCSGFKGHLTIGNNVVTIKDDAFATFENMTGNLTIPNSVKTIGDNAFQLWYSLSGTVTLGSGLTSLSNSAFIGCCGVKKVVNKSDISIDLNTFNYEYDTDKDSVKHVDYTWINEDTGAQIDKIINGIAIRDSFNDTNGFTLRRDNNSWTHRDDTAQDGFYGVYDNCFWDLKYFLKLTEGESFSVKADIIEKMFSQFTGNCFGIAATMGLLFHKITKIDDYYDKRMYSYYSPSCYFDLVQKPKDDHVLMDVIQFYFLSQYIPNNIAYGYFSPEYTGNKTDYVDYQKNNLKEMLESLCKKVNNNNPALLGYNYYDYTNGKKVNHGHAILAVNSWDNDDGRHIVKLYDMNSVQSDTPSGTFKYMIISADYSTFEMGKINQDNLLYMCIYDWNKMKTLNDTEDNTKYTKGKSNPGALTGRTQSLEAGATEENHAIVTTSGDFYITNKKGEYLTNIHGPIEGDMQTYNCNPIINDSDEQIIQFEIDDSDTFMTDRNIVNISIGSDNGYMSIEGEGFDEISFSYAEGIKMKGASCKFKAFLQTDNNVADYQKGLASISAKGTGTTIIKKDGNSVKATTDGSLSDVVIANYIGIDKSEKNISGTVTEISVGTTKTNLNDETSDNGSSGESSENRTEIKPIETKYKETVDIKNTMLSVYMKEHPDVVVKKVKFKSSNKKVAKVNKKGIVKGGKQTGIATITMFVKTQTVITKPNGKQKKKLSKWTSAGTLTVNNIGKQ